ncbi:MAG: hypothetical protein WCK13_06605 [Ignavibacteriota bacterium]
MIRRTYSYILIFSFLLTASGCFTTKNYSDPPEVFIAKEKENKGVKNDNIDSLTLINNKSISLSDYTSRFIKNYMDSSYKFVYYYKTSVLDTIDIKSINLVHYSITKSDNKRFEREVLPYIGLAILIPLAIIGLAALLLPHGLGG